MNRINILEYGAVPNTGILQTLEIQAALNAATANHGATVVIPAGEFLTGTLNLGGASLYLEKGAILKGSPDIADYPFYGYDHNEMGKTLSLLYAMDQTDIRISGEGTIDLNGEAFYDMTQANVPDCGFELTEKQKGECTRPIGQRPNQPIFFLRCTRLRIEGIRIINAPCWTMSFVECEDIRVTGLTIDNSEILPNNDGMHFCSCRKVFVRECNITAGDDCIALSCITDWDKPCEDIIISDCILKSCSKAIVVGYMHSIVRNVAISNCLILDSNRAFCIMTSSRTGLVENVLVSNMRLDTRIRAGNWWGNGEPVAIIATKNHLANYARPVPDRFFPVSVRNIRFQNLVCTGENVIGLVGEGDNVHDVFFSNISMELKESENIGIKGRLVDASPGAQIARLPEGKVCWLLLQGVQDITFENVRISPFQGKIPGVFTKDCERIMVDSIV